MATSKIPSLQWCRRPFALLLAALPALLGPLVAMAAERTPPAGPPTSYRLDAIKLRLQRQPGQGQPKLSLVVADAGNATLESGRPPITVGFTLPADDVLALLSGLYRLRFFDLPAVLRARPSVFLMPDGAVGTQIANRMDTTSCMVCITLPGYEKCVRYAEGDGPPDLEAWVQAAFATAQRHSAPTTPGK